jgi:hypothetical protein
MNEALETTEMEKCVICNKPIKDDRVMAVVLEGGEETTLPAHGKCRDKELRKFNDWMRNETLKAEFAAKQAKRKAVR